MRFGEQWFHKIICECVAHQPCKQSTKPHRQKKMRIMRHISAVGIGCAAELDVCCDAHGGYDEVCEGCHRLQNRHAAHKPLSTFHFVSIVLDGKVSVFL